MVAALQPDLVVLDISMPVMNGMQAAAKIREVAPQTKIVVLSTHDSPYIIEESLRVGVALYLTKIEASSDLVRKVDELFANPSGAPLSQRENMSDQP